MTIPDPSPVAPPPVSDRPTMDVLAVGLPSALTIWGFELVGRLIRAAAPDCAVLRLDRMDPLPERAAGGTRLILSTFPHPGMVEAARRAGARMIAFLDDVEAAVTFTQVTGQIATIPALRPVSVSLTLVAAVTSDPQALVIRRSDNQTPEQIVRAIIRHLRLEDEGVLQSALGPMQPHLGGALSAATGGVSMLTADLDREVIRDVTDGLLPTLTGEPPGPISWPRQCFFNGDEPNAYAPVVQELTGRARIIYYGPYFHLPAGLWHVSVRIGFSADIHESSLTLDVVSRVSLGSARIKPPGGGLFQAEFFTTVTEPHEPIEVRIMSEQGAIEGYIALVAVDFQSADHLSPAILSALGFAEASVA